MINGRSMPDDMDTNYAAQYPHQPYKRQSAHAPGRARAVRIIGQDAGNIPSTSTATTYAFWRAMAT